MPRDETRYVERLGVPWSWWLAAPGLGVVAVIVLVVTSLPTVVIIAMGIVVAVFVGWLLARYGVRIAVSDDGLLVGRALLPWWACGSVVALGREQSRSAFGSGADARAYLVLRAYCDGAVRVDVDDPADPTPYWLISSRHAERLAKACLDARASA
jgi:Protein of unknown function (DUF3093)